LRVILDDAAITMAGQVGNRQTAVRLRAQWHAT